MMNMFGGDTQYTLENISLWFQGGVRRGFLVFGLAGILLCFPLYFITTLASSTWFQMDINPFGLDSTSYFQKKEIVQNDIIISQSQLVPLKGGVKELYVSINNKSNPEIGFMPFRYTLIVQDANNAIIDQSTRDTYVLPGDIKYIVYRSNNGNAQSLTLRMEENGTQQVYYNPFSKVYRKPLIEITNQQYQVRSSTSILYITCTIKNNDSIDVSEVDLIYNVRDNRESIVGIGDFVVSNLKAGEQRDIVIPYTQPESREPRYIDINWNVNFLKKSLT